MKTLATVLLMVTLVSSLSGCASMSRRDGGTVAGAVGGGVLGHVLTGGNVIGTVGGAIGGGYLGNHVSK